MSSMSYHWQVLSSDLDNNKLLKRGTRSLQLQDVKTFLGISLHSMLVWSLITLDKNVALVRTRL